MRLVAIFGPTAIGKTSVAIALAELLRERGEDPVAVNCDAMQIYRGLELVSAAPDAAQLAALDHRLIGAVAPTEQFSAGRFAALAQAEIDALLAAGRRPILVGGTGLYLRAALSELELRPPVPAAIRQAVERELAEQGPEQLHRRLPERLAATSHPNDRKRIARLTELHRAGIEPATGSAGLWTSALRHPTYLAGLVMERRALVDRIEARVEQMASRGAVEQARFALSPERADPARQGAAISRTARQMIGLEAFAAGDLERAKLEHRRYARRQLTWMRKMQGVEPIDRSGRGDAEIAAQILSGLDAAGDGVA